MSQAVLVNGSASTAAAAESHAPSADGNDPTLPNREVEDCGQFSGALIGRLQDAVNAMDRFAAYVGLDLSGKIPPLTAIDNPIDLRIALAEHSKLWGVAFDRVLEFIRDGGAEKLGTRGEVTTWLSYVKQGFAILAAATDTNDLVQGKSAAWSNALVECAQNCADSLGSWEANIFEPMLAPSREALDEYLAFVAEQKKEVTDKVYDPTDITEELSKEVDPAQEAVEVRQVGLSKRTKQEEDGRFISIDPLLEKYMPPERAYVLTEDGKLIEFNGLARILNKGGAVSDELIADTYEELRPKRIIDDGKLNLSPDGQSEFSTDVSAGSWVRLKIANQYQLDALSLSGESEVAGRVQLCRLTGTYSVRVPEGADKLTYRISRRETPHVADKTLWSRWNNVLTNSERTLQNDPERYATFVQVGLSKEKPVYAQNIDLQRLADSVGSLALPLWSGVNTGDCTILASSRAYEMNQKGAGTLLLAGPVLKYDGRRRVRSIAVPGHMQGQNASGRLDPTCEVDTSLKVDRHRLRSRVEGFIAQAHELAEAGDVEGLRELGTEVREAIVRERASSEIKSSASGGHRYSGGLPFQGGTGRSAELEQIRHKFQQGLPQQAASLLFSSKLEKARGAISEGASISICDLFESYLCVAKHLRDDETGAELRPGGIHSILLEEVREVVEQASDSGCIDSEDVSNFLFRLQTLWRDPRDVANLESLALLPALKSHLPKEHSDLRDLITAVNCASKGLWIYSERVFDAREAVVSHTLDLLESGEVVFPEPALTRLLVETLMKHHKGGAGAHDAEVKRANLVRKVFDVTEGLTIPDLVIQRSKSGTSDLGYEYPVMSWNKGVYGRLSDAARHGAFQEYFTPDGEMRADCREEIARRVADVICTKREYFSMLENWNDDDPIPYIIREFNLDLSPHKERILDKLVSLTRDIPRDEQIGWPGDIEKRPVSCSFVDGGVMWRDGGHDQLFCAATRLIELGVLTEDEIRPLWPSVDEDKLAVDLSRELEAAWGYDEYKSQILVRRRGDELQYLFAEKVYDAYYDHRVERGDSPVLGHMHAMCRGRTLPEMQSPSQQMMRLWRERYPQLWSKVSSSLDSLSPSGHSIEDFFRYRAEPLMAAKNETWAKVQFAIDELTAREVTSKDGPQGLYDQKAIDRARARVSKRITGMFKKVPLEAYGDPADLTARIVSTMGPVAPDSFLGTLSSHEQMFVFSAYLQHDEHGVALEVPKIEPSGRDFSEPSMFPLVACLTPMSAPKSIDEVKNAVREVREVERVLLSSGARGGTPFEKALRKAVESKQARRAGDEYDKLASLREYQPGDDIRRIDHKASGRRGKLLVAQYHDSDESLKTDKAAFILDLDYLGMDPEQMNKFPTRLKHFLGLLYVAQRSHPTELYVTFKGEMIHHLSEEKLSSMLHSDSGDEALVGQLWEYRDRIAAQYQHKGRERIVALPGGVIDHELSKRGFEDASVVAAIHPKNLEQGMVALENYKRNHGCQITYL